MLKLSLNEILTVYKEVHTYIYKLSIILIFLE